MRRMLTNKNVVDMVNQGIENGEIKTGLPEIEAGDAGKVLAVNTNEDGTEWITPEAGGSGAFELNGVGTLIAGKNKSPITAPSGNTANLIINSVGTSVTGTFNAQNLKNSIYFANITNNSTNITSENSIVFNDRDHVSPASYKNSIVCGFANDNEMERVSNMNNSCKLGKFVYGLGNNTIDDSFIAGASNSVTYQRLAYGGKIQRVISVGSPYVNTTASALTNVKDCLFLCGLYGDNESTQTQINKSNNASSLVGVSILGPGGHLMEYDTAANSAGILVCGRYSTSDATEHRFVVGAGTSTSDRANCFVAGNNSTDGDYIKVGDTKLTEAQLQALLATL